MPKSDDEICRRLVELLTKHTGIEWSFGYLGNTYGIPGTPAYEDDRRLYAFAAHPGRVGTSSDSIGGVMTEELSELVIMLRGAVELAVVLKTPR